MKIIKGGLSWKIYIPLWTEREREREMFYLTTHSTHFIYGYMASDIIWLRTILIVRKETRCRHIGYSYRLAARVLLYAPSHRQDNTYHGLCYTSRGALVGMRNSSMGPPHEGSIRRPTAPWANTLPLSYVPLPVFGLIPIPTSSINTHIFKNNFLKGKHRNIKKSYYLLHGDHHLYKNNYLPITRDDETAGVQFVDWLMFT